MNFRTFSIIAAAFVVAMFLLIRFGLMGGSDSTLASSLATTFGLGIFFAVYFSMERFTERLDLKRKVDRFQVAKSNDTFNRQVRRNRRRIEQIYAPRRSLIDSIARAVQTMLGLEGNRLQALRMELMAAGYLRERALTIYLMMSAVVPVVGFFVGGILAVVIGSDSSGLLMGMAFGTVAAFAFLKLFVRGKIKERRRQLVNEIPDLIDLLVIYAESGIAFDTALQRVLEALRKRCPVAVTEMSILQRELQILPDRGKAYDNLVKRAGVPQVRSLVAVLVQSEKIGSSISQALRQLAEETRRERLVDAERRAAKIPIIMQIPMILFVLPALLAVLVGPVVLKLLTMFVKT